MVQLCNRCRWLGYKTTVTNSQNRVNETTINLCSKWARDQSFLMWPNQYASKSQTDRNDSILTFRNADGDRNIHKQYRPKFFIWKEPSNLNNVCKGFCFIKYPNHARILLVVLHSIESTVSIENLQICNVSSSIWFYLLSSLWFPAQFPRKIFTNLLPHKQTHD